MRPIGWLSLVLLGLGWLASEVPLAETQQERQVETGWRRTVDGWEHSSRWTSDGRICRPALHPSVVGLSQLLLALAALIALSKDRDPARDRWTRGPQNASRR